MKLSLKSMIIPLTAVLLSGCVFPFGPSDDSTSAPTSEPTSVPTSEPTSAPTSDPTSEPSTKTTTPIGPQVLPSDYYDLEKYDLNGKIGPSLQFELHRLMLDTHTKLIRYADFSSYTKNTTSNPVSIDQVSESVKKNEFFYTGKEANLGTSYTREHVWPCAKSGGMWTHKKEDGVYYVDGTNYVGGGSDLYHVRPCTNSVNTGRGDSRFKEFSEDEKRAAEENGTVFNDGGPYVLYCDQKTFSNYSEPADEFKGDIARILMYVYIHYSKMGNYNWEIYCGSLSLTDVMGYATADEAREALVRWNEMDLPSETEILRNKTIEGIQGNRNPFVDYPHLIRNCFGL